MRACWLRTLGVFLYFAAAAHLLAGGSGLNVVVVVNQNSTNSVQLGNYYCERRHVPPQNYLRINWPGGNVDWTNSDFKTYLLNPLLGMLASRQLTNQIDYVVLSMDIPYRVYQGGTSTTSGTNSTTAALYYGFKTDLPAGVLGPFGSCNLPTASTNSYAGSESIFRSNPPSTATTNALLTMMITSSNLAQAKALVDHGVMSDGTFPPQPVILGKGADYARTVRYVTFDNAIFNTRLRGNYTMYRTNMDSTLSMPLSFTNALGYEGGHYQFSILPNAFVPGAMADSLTSYGGLLYEPIDHTVLLVYLNAGASGSYGTIVEPCLYLEKFPSPQNYFYQARGFSLAECYYQAVTNPYQGIMVGEPLAAPFAQPPTGAWSNLPTNALLAGTTNLSVQFNATDANHPVQQIDLFLDDQWMQTLTNIVPRQNNVLNVTIGGQLVSYTVPASATIKSVASGLASSLNANASLTKAVAYAHGDRIELQSTNISKTGSQVSLAATSTIGTGSALTTFIAASGSGFLDSTAHGTLLTFTLPQSIPAGFQITGNPTTTSAITATITKTNGAQVNVTATYIAGSATTLFQIVQQLLNSINSNANLTGADGVNGQDLLDTSSGTQQVQFNLFANSPGWNAAEVQVSLSGSGFSFSPSGQVRLDGNVNDLRPRAHLYITDGATTLPVTFGFNTTTQMDGFHTLTAVAYEGSHVRTQGRVSQTIQIQNSSLAATFTTLVGGTNTALEATLQFSVTANTGSISKIELFSTGGSLGSVLNQSSATFAVGCTNLGIGLHPFYAIVTPSTGKQYRTETKWIRILGADSPFAVALKTPPPKLTWPATAGRSYDILSTTNLAKTYQTNASVTPSNTGGQWVDPAPVPTQRFYRVRTSQ